MRWMNGISRHLRPLPFALLLAGAAACAAPEPPGDTSGAATRAPEASPWLAAADAGVASEGSPRRVVVDGVDLTGVGYDRGSATAPVVLVNFSDFGCPYCAKFALETEPILERDYVRTGKLFIKYVPFVMGMFPNGERAARAAECAAEQGKFREMHDQLYAQQRDWKRSLAADSLLTRTARTLGLDAARFASCQAAPGLHPRTQRANVAAEALGVRVTPSFLLNGRGIEGAPPLPQLREILDALVQQAGRD